MVHPKVLAVAVLSAALLIGCARGEDTEPASGEESGEVEEGGNSAIEVEDVQQEPGAQAVDSTVLFREVFAYSGSGRDPFRPLVTPRGLGQAGPLFEYLRVTSIYYDAAFPARSVAVVRDTTLNQRYDLKVGDLIGRMWVEEIRPREVILAFEEFGQTRQNVLTLGRRQEEIR